MTDIEKPKSGVFYDMPPEEYFRSRGKSNSALSFMAMSPRHYWANAICKPPEKAPTPAMMAGSLAHCAILEPDMLATRYFPRPDEIDLRTKEGKAWAASVPFDSIVVSSAQMATATAQGFAIREDPDLSDLLDDGKSEVSVFWVDEATGYQCKARPDWVHPLSDGRVIILDIKTTSDASPKEFAKSVVNYGYHRQQAHYSAGWKAATGNDVAAFIFGVVTSSYPFISAAYMLDDQAVEFGEKQVAKLLQQILDCETAASWPAYGSGIQTLSLPSWAVREYS